MRVIYNEMIGLKCQLLLSKKTILNCILLYIKRANNCLPVYQKVLQGISVMERCNTGFFICLCLKFSILTLRKSITEDNIMECNCNSFKK